MGHYCTEKHCDACDGPQETYTPTVGDRVRVTDAREGTVVSVYQGTVFLAEGSGFALEPAYDNVVRTWEKLQDPEPQWVNGDVVRLTILDPQSPYATFVRTEGRGWQGPLQTAILDAKLSAYWRDGKLDILYKTDAYDGDYLS